MDAIKKYNLSYHINLTGTGRAVKMLATVELYALGCVF